MKALELDPNYCEAYFGLAKLYSELGQAPRAVNCHRKAVELRRNCARTGSNMIYMLHYDPAVTQQQLFEEHAAWGKRHAEPHYPKSNDGGSDVSASPGGRLRVGYVSCDYRAHPVARFIEAALEHHDKSKFEIFLYSAVAEPDHVTERVKKYGHVFRDIAQLSDDEAAQLIRDDQIDILMDLMGHIGGHRLMIFARKPAPIQMTYLGYPDTTGMTTIDYRITDSYHDPAGETEQYHTEELIRLDPCAWCWRPDSDGLGVNELPALEAGHVTFGCLNKFVKITPAILRLWSRILGELPGSKIKVLLNKYDPSDPILYEYLESNGLSREQVIIVGRQPRRQYLQEYHGIDIALDTFPYNGHTTTCDALWMGVPVVSMVGKIHVARAGLSVLSNVGLPEYLTYSEEEYVEKAIKPTKDLTALAALRRRLRPMMEQSPLRDETGFTRRMEATYIEICASKTKRRPSAAANWKSSRVGVRSSLSLQF